jgi:LacI family transcriptional regulator
VIGFDNTTIAQSEFVGLSTVDYARQQMGERTLALLKERIADPTCLPREVTLTPGLIARTTTAGPSST